MDNTIIINIVVMVNSIIKVKVKGRKDYIIKENNAKYKVVTFSNRDLNSNRYFNKKEDEIKISRKVFFCFYQGFQVY